MTRVFAACAVFLSLSSIVPAGAARADEVPLDKQKGVRGRVVVAPELLTTPVKLSPAREKAIRGTAFIRRPLGRPLGQIVEPAPALVVMLEGLGIRPETAELPSLKIVGQRFIPGSIVMARPGAVHIQNGQKTDVTVVDETGALVAKIPAGQAADANLRVGEHILSVSELPWATEGVRVLERGRVLPQKDGEIPLIDIPGGEYRLTFFLGAEPLRIQPLQVPEQGLVFIDATVSALKVVEVSIKDASMRVAVPPSNLPKEDGGP